MRLSIEVYTRNVLACRDFYIRHLNFVVKYEVDGFVVLQSSQNAGYELMFCIPESPFVNKVFHPEFSGYGVILQVEVTNVEMDYEKFLSHNIPIVVPLVKEAVNGYHFTIRDPANMLIDLVQF